jgi:hypothetical protein
MNKTFSFDAETNGLWGEPFAIGALVYNESGEETARFVARLSDEKVTNDWVQENVLPQIKAIPVTHQSYTEMLKDFAAFYMQHKEGADILVHMGVPVEAKILRDMYEFGFIGEWDCPFPLCDLAGNLQQAGENPTSVDEYIKKYELCVPDFEGGTHNPLYDSAVAAAVYRHLRAEHNAIGDGERQTTSFRCCEKAERLPCMCYQAWTCPEHGETHIGTHD